MHGGYYVRGDDTEIAAIERMNALEEVERMSPEARAAYEAAKIEEEEKARLKAEEEARQRAEEAARAAAEHAA